MRREKPEFEQKLLDLARVTRVVKGGRRFRFRATLVMEIAKVKLALESPRARMFPMRFKRLSMMPRNL